MMDFERERKRRGGGGAEAVSNVNTYGVVTIVPYHIRFRTRINIKFLS